MDKILNRIDRNDFIFDSGIHTFINPYSYVLLRNFDKIDHLDKVYVDGASAVFFLRKLGFKIQRKSFDMTSLAPEVFIWCIENNKTISFIGSKEHELRLTLDFLSDQFPDLKIIYSHHGYIMGNESIKKRVINELSNLNPDVVIVGMGTLLQEEFLVDLKMAGWKGLGFTCGGFIHQTSRSGLKYYPDFFNKYNLRWLYRIFDEPKLLTRYLIDYPKFVFYIYYDFYHLKKKLKKY